MMASISASAAASQGQLLGVAHDNSLILDGFDMSRASEPGHNRQRIRRRRRTYSRTFRRNPMKTALAFAGAFGEKRIDAPKYLEGVGRRSEPRQATVQIYRMAPTTTELAEALAQPDPELRDRKFPAAIREDREPHASVAQVMPCYHALADQLVVAR